MTLNKASFDKAKKFVLKNARPLDKALFRFTFENGSVEDVINELVKYQNSDGGFGHGLEPDIRSSLSSPIATTIAFQYLNRLDLEKTPDFVEQALNYFDSTFNKDILQWFSISSEVNDSPHAPWWQFDEEKERSDESWGNPTVEIIGYYLRYRGLKGNPIINEALDKALERIKTKETIETHELQCYFRMYKCVPSDTKHEIFPHLEKHIKKTVEQDPKKWEGYVTKPLTFVDSTDSPFYDLFKDLVPLELNSLVKSIDKDGAWYPAWEWSDYLETWKRVKVELAGLVTVKNLILLRNFDQIDI